MSAIPTFINQTTTQLDTNSEEINMSASIAVPVRKTKPAAKKTAAKKEPAVPAKTKTQKTTVAKKPAPKAASKAAPKAKPTTKREPKMFLVYRNIESDVTAQTRKAKSFDPIRYEGVLSGASITSARKALAELKGDEADKYDVAYSYDDKLLTQKALRKFDKAFEKITKKGKSTFIVTLKNVDGLTQDEAQELALYVWVVDAAKKATKPVGNERMLDREFNFDAFKPLKNGRANVTFTTN